MRAHQLDADGVILQTIIVDSLDFMPGLVDASIGGQAGDSIINGALVLAKPPLAPVPRQVAMWQARAILIEDGLLDAVNAVLAAIPDPQARQLAQAKFEYSSTVQRDDPLVTVVIPKLGKSEADIDQMFRRAEVAK